MQSDLAVVSLDFHSVWYRDHLVSKNGGVTGPKIFCYGAMLPD